MGIRTYLNSLAVDRHFISANGGQSNNSGPGERDQYDAEYIAVIPGTYIYYNNEMQPLQIGVNNKNSDVAGNRGGYELTLSYNLNLATGKNVYLAKRDQGGTQLANDAGSASVTQNTVSTGSKSFTIGTGLTYEVGQNVMARNSAGNYMIGVCSGYNSVNGAFSMNSITVVGSGTYSSWTISLMTWSAAVRNQYCDEWLTYIYRVIDACEADNILYKIILFFIQGEEDARNSTKAAAYGANLTALFGYMISKIQEYILTNYPATIIPYIKTLIAELPSNNGADGDAVRAGQAAFVALDPENRKLVSRTGVTFNADGVHLDSAAFMLKGAGEAKDDVLAFWV